MGNHNQNFQDSIPTNYLESPFLTCRIGFPGLYHLEELTILHNCETPSGLPFAVESFALWIPLELRVLPRVSWKGCEDRNGLTIPKVDHPIDQAHLEKMVKRAVQEYSYKNTIEPTAYRPYKYWVSREEEKFNPVFVGNDRYATWRTGPYNSAAWNRYTTYLPRIPREAGMDAILRGMPMEYPPKPERLNNYEREVVVNMLNSLSRKQLPYVQHQYSIPGRMPYQGYYSPCTGRHYCLRGMDYYVDGAPSTERQISQLVEKIEFPILRPPGGYDAQCTIAKPAAIFPVYEP